MVQDGMRLALGPTEAAGGAGRSRFCRCANELSNAAIRPRPAAATAAARTPATKAVATFGAAASAVVPSMTTEQCSCFTCCACCACCACCTCCTCCDCQRLTLRAMHPGHEQGWGHQAADKRDEGHENAAVQRRGAVGRSAGGCRRPVGNPGGSPPLGH